MNNLATIQVVKNVRHHPNADALDLVQVLGWQVVTKRDEYKDGELTVYVVSDTILPEKPDFEFLRNKNFSIKPIRLRGEESSGICFKLNIIPDYLPEYKGIDTGEAMISATEGLDVSDLLGVKHYEKPMPVELAGQAEGMFPSFLIITDEYNLRTYPNAVPEMWSRPYYITRKDDGCSGTFFLKDSTFGVCSRRIHLKDSEGNGFWRMARKYDLEAAIAKSFPNMNVAIQGECVGPGIQDNRLGLKEMELHVFNLFDITTRQYLSRDKIIKFCADNSIPMVTEVCNGSIFGYTMEDLINIANEQKYPTGGHAEGIVIRPTEPFFSSVLKKSWSGKILNEKYKD